MRNNAKPTQQNRQPFHWRAGRDLRSRSSGTPEGAPARAIARQVRHRAPPGKVSQSVAYRRTQPTSIDEPNHAPGIRKISQYPRPGRYRPDPEPAHSGALPAGHTVPYRAIAGQCETAGRSPLKRTIANHTETPNRRRATRPARNISQHSRNPPPGIRGILPVVPPQTGVYAADAYRPGSDEWKQCTGYKAVSRGARESVTRAP